MLKKIISKYALKKLLESDDSGLIIADNNRKILWYNKKLKELTGLQRIKGKSLETLFENFAFDAGGLNNNHYEFKEKNNSVSVEPLKTLKTLDGYFAKVTPNNSDEQNSSDDDRFINELQNIFTLLIKENSLSKLSNEILNKCVYLSKSYFGIIVYNNQSDKHKYDFIILDPSGYIQNFNYIKKDVESNFSFLNKWLKTNNKSLVGNKSPNSLASNLTKLLRADSVILSPCFFDKNHIATIIVGKTKGTYSSSEINIVDQFAALLSFSIINIRSRELNTALENRLLQAQKLETIGKLSSGMAHDFSNLLSSIFGSLNLLRKRAPESENITKLIDNIENCSIRAMDLTKGLLSFGKPTSKRKELIKPNLLLSEISKVVTHTFPKRILFDSNVDESLYDILGNGTEVYQVLLNLCVNAKEAIENNGVIRLTGKNIQINRSNNANYPLLNPGNYVWFSVQDNGSGIDEDNLLKIFDPYFSTKVKETGSGLGLYVTYGIIKAHNGEVQVSSPPGEGTTFDVFIPAYEPTKSKNIKEEKIILLAEDEIMLSDLLTELLESAGYNVIKVFNGAEVLRVLTEEIQVDMVIMDYNMPGMNGVECAARIRELNLNMPIVLSSGSQSMETNLEAKKAGITGFVNKPYEFDTLLQTIHTLL